MQGQQNIIICHILFPTSHIRIRKNLQTFTLENIYSFFLEYQAIILQ